MSALNMHTQVEYEVIHKVTPSLTDMRKFAPPKLDIPVILLVQSIEVKYIDKYIFVEPMDRCMRKWAWVYCGELHLDCQT